MSKIQHFNKTIQKLKRFIAQDHILVELSIFGDDLVCISYQKEVGSAKPKIHHLARLILSEQVSCFIWSWQGAGTSDQLAFHHYATRLGAKEGLTLIHEANDNIVVLSLACFGNVETFKQAFLDHHADLKQLLPQIARHYRTNERLKAIIKNLFGELSETTQKL